MDVYSYTHYTRPPLPVKIINDVFIDEFTFIHWELQANLIPKFGYCSEKFDDVAWGKSLIQGQLAINFVSPGYLIGALMGKQVTATGSATPGISDPAATQQQLYQGSFSMREGIAARARLLRRQSNRTVAGSVCLAAVRQGRAGNRQLCVPESCSRLNGNLAGADRNGLYRENRPKETDDSFASDGGKDLRWAGANSQVGRGDGRRADPSFASDSWEGT